MPRLMLRLLGPPQFVLGGESIISFESDKVRALLIYLAVEADRPHRRETLAALLWPESPARTAKDNLRQAISNLRSAVGDRARSGDRTAGRDQDITDPFLLVSRQTVQFNTASDYWLDVNAFDELLRDAQLQIPEPDQDHLLANLQQADALYRGEFLEGFSLSDSVAFEEWALFTREWLHRLALDALYRAAELFAARGDWAQAQARARRQIELEPWREEAHRQLMRALALGGQRSAALAQYETCRRIMVEKLGAEPAEETTALYRQIMDGDLTGPPAIAAAAAAPLIPPPPCPYRGLFAFREEDAALFFGREAFTRQLVETVRQQPLVAVIGPSGSGKSSVLHAGLLPPLRREGDWAIVDCRPGSQPFHALAVALIPLLEPGLSETDRLVEINKLAQALDQGDLSLDSVTERILAAQQDRGASRLLLVLDQFEELYTLCPEESLRARFVDALLAATVAGAAAATAGPHIALTLRADFMGRALAHRPFADALQGAALILGPMARHELGEAIENPAKLRGVAFEAGLVTRILDDIEGGPGNLPLIQFALTSLWEKQTSGQLTHAAYDAVGQVEGSLASYAEQVYAALNSGEREAMQRGLVQMVRPGEGTEDTRRVATRVELGEEGWALAQRLANARLAVTDQDESTGLETVEVVHEALIQGWDRLRVWMNADRTFRAWQERMRGMLRQWQVSGEDADALLRGALLVEAENWLAEREGNLSAAGRAFIQASLDARQARRVEEAARLAREAELERRDRNRLRALVAVLAVATVVALGLTLFAFHQRGVAEREAAVSQSLNLSTSAQVALDEGNTDLALGLALAANQIIDPPPQAQLVLAEAAYAPGTRRRFAGHTAPVEGLAISSDGRTALSASADGTLILWDLETGESLRHFEGHADVVHDVALLPSGDRALSASADGTLILWDLETGEVMHTFTGHESAVWSVAISPDGRTALSGAADGTLILWSFEIGEPLRRLEGHAGAVYSVAISPGCSSPLSAGCYALSGSADRSVIMWDLETGEVLHKMAGVADTVAGSQEAIGHYDSVWEVAFLPDGRTALSVSQDEFAILWDLETGELVTRFDTNIGLFSVAVRSDGRTALLGTLDNRVLLLDLESGQITLQLRGHTARVMAVAFTPDGRGALSGAATGALRLWNLYNGAEMRCITYTYPSDPAAAAVAVSPDGRLGMTALWTGEISLWDYASGVEVHRLRGHTQMAFGGVLFLPDSRRAVSGAGDIFAASSDNTVRVWDVETGEELLRLEGHTDKIWDIDVSADGRFVASGSHDGTLRLWDISTLLNAGIESGESRVLLDTYPQAVRSVAFSPDGRFLVVGLAKGQSSNPDYSLRLLEVETGREVRRLVGHQEVVGDVAFSPDGKLILSGSNEIAILWDAASGVEVHRLTGHAASVVAIAFSPDGRLAVSGAVDSSLLLWDVEAGMALRRYVGFTKPIVGVAFVPDGRSFFVAADDNAVHEYRVDATEDSLLAWIAANRYAPELTCQQRARYRVEPLCQEGSAP